jgi:hypothetical protein
MSKTTIPTGGITADAIDATLIADDAISEEHLDATAITGHTALAATPANTDELLISDAGTLKRIDFSYLKSGTLVEVAQSSISAGSSVSAVEFSNIFSSTYNTYFVRMSKIRYAGDTRLQMRFYSDTGTTEYSGSYYYYVSYGLAVGGGEERNNDSGADRLYLTETLDQDQPADGGATGFFYIDNPLANDNFSVTCIGQIAYRDTSNVWNGTNFNGKYSGSSPRYGFKLYGSSNVEYADITVYGVAP